MNYLLTSHVWRQDQNGFTHQDPGFIDLVANKKAEVIRVYLPPDANTLLSVTDHCLRSRSYVNVIIAGKQPAPQWLDMDAAIKHCSAGIGIWAWASNDGGGEPDVVMACCGDVPTMETLAAVELLRKQFPELKVRVINVVDLMKLQSEREQPHGLSDKDFDLLFTTNKPVIFAHHGHPTLIHRLTYNRTNHRNIHVHGYREEGTITTPFDLVAMNELDRFRLVVAVVDRVSTLGPHVADVNRSGTSALPFWRNVASPGSLSSTHAFLGAQCESCHTPNRGIKAEACVTCHASDAIAIAKQSTAFHATIGECRGCHIEHQGANVRPTKVDHTVLLAVGVRKAHSGINLGQPSAADVGALQHYLAEITGSRLTAESQALDCASCHSYRDRHKGLVGQQCADCHKTETWKIAGFLHPSPKSQECNQCHQAPPSHYMMHFEMMDKGVTGQKNARVEQCFLCHQTDAFNDIKGVGWFKMH